MICAVPNKYYRYMLPYVFKDKWGGCYVRKEFGRAFGVSVYKKRYDIWQREEDPTPNNDWVNLYSVSNLISFSTPEEAKIDLDKELIKRGFYLIKENEIERFEKKLSLLI